MQIAKKLVRALALIQIATTASRAATVYQNAFDSGDASLNGLNTFGSGTISVSGGQLVFGLTGPNYSGTGLNLGLASPLYSPVLRNNPGIITWAVNVSNQDGSANNGFAVVLAASSLDPYDISTVGYALKGGSMVGNRMTLYSFDFGLGGGGNVIVDIPSSNGLGPLPAFGSYRVTYDASSDTWAVYGQAGASYVDPGLVSNLLGSGIDSARTSDPLPYFSLAGQTSGNDYFDNLRITTSVPEPSVLAIVTVGGILLMRLRKTKSRLNEPPIPGI